MSKPLPGQLGFQFGGATAAKTITDNVRNGFEPTASSTIAQDPKADLIEPGVPILATIYFLGAYGQICRRGDDAIFIKVRIDSRGRRLWPVDQPRGELAESPSL